MPGGSERLRSRNKDVATSTTETPLKNIRNRNRNITRKNKWIPHKPNVKVALVASVLCIIIFMLLSRSFQKKSSIEDPKVAVRRLLTPVSLPKMTDLPIFGGEHRESLYWGTYRPHLYFGIRARTPRSLMFGLMWLGVKDGQYVLRHTCEMSDGLLSYSWLRHDGRNFGQQMIVDHGLSIATTFLKSRDGSTGYGGDWAVRLQVENNRFSDENAWKNSHLFFYIAEEADYPLKLGNGISKFINNNNAVVSGNREDIGWWELHCKGMDNLEIHYAAYNTPHFHNLTELVQQSLAMQMIRTRNLQLPDISESHPNVIVFQISKRIPLDIDLVFVSGIKSGNAAQKERIESLSGIQLTNRIREQEDSFDRRFEKTFNLTNKFDAEVVEIGKSAASTLIGGIGYFYGQSRISIPNEYKGVVDRDYALYWEAPLYTAVPSRSFFPRGFLWDEGFHQLLVRKWDVHLCLDILGHWLDLMNQDGWIPREQILGAEALRKVPEEFVLQKPSNANPPTLFLVLQDLASEVMSLTTTEKDDVMSFLHRAFPRLDLWFNWFNTTQTGKVVTSFYWHGRDNTTDLELNPKTLSSGLDDYPRASHPSEDERHVDLRCWMALAADCMHLISKLIGPVNEVYERAKLQLTDINILNQMHYDNISNMYQDFGNHSEQVSLKWNEFQDRQTYTIKRELRRVVRRIPTLRFVPHFGYVSLFPLIMKIIPPKSPIVKTQLDLLGNRTLLWTDFGLRSLAKSSSLYMKHNTEHDPPYWRGPIWINMNYLVLSALNYYAHEEGPYRSTAVDVYERLRDNLIRNIVDNYNKTGYFWEQYNAASGKGKGAHPFNGWTSLVVLIMAEKY